MNPADMQAESYVEAVALLLTFELSLNKPISCLSPLRGPANPRNDGLGNVLLQGTLAFLSELLYGWFVIGLLGDFGASFQLVPLLLMKKSC